VPRHFGLRTRDLFEQYEGMIKMTTTTLTKGLMVATAVLGALLVRRASGTATVVGSRCRGLLVGACEWQSLEVRLPARDAVIHVSP
jgi:hypothetical protein